MKYINHQIINLIGKKFNRLTVVSFLKVYKGQTFWECCCDCGNKCIAVSARLKNGQKKSCGCLYKNNGRSIINLSGKRFGRLKVISFYKREGGQTFWKCLCNCGNIIFLSSEHLKRYTKSCGCLRKENMHKLGLKKGKEHGAYKHGNSCRNKMSREYRTWLNMRQRCNNPDNGNYKHYGGRGIKICNRWLNFKNFLNDMGKRPKNKTIDRINNNGDYTRKNCRWATSKEQSSNKRNTKLEN